MSKISPPYSRDLNCVYTWENAKQRLRRLRKLTVNVECRVQLLNTVKATCKFHWTGICKGTRIKIPTRGGFKNRGWITGHLTLLQEQEYPA